MDNKMTPYLIRGTVYYTPYEGSRIATDDMRIVMANSTEEARTKYEDWWHNKSVEYSHSYYADCEVLETIE